MRSLQRWQSQVTANKRAKGGHSPGALSKHIHAVTDRGIELKAALFLIAFAVVCFGQQQLRLPRELGILSADSL